MLIKDIVDEDFVNYKKTSMFIIFPFCTFKCEKECNEAFCQNQAIVSLPNKEISVDKIVERYTSNIITKAIVCGGLEPFDSFEDLILLINKLREKTHDDIVIYTGYREEEIKEQIVKLQKFDNIIIKFGRFIPNATPIFDKVLGLTLVSENQYAKKIS